jgi:hypothetical protein
LLNENQPADGSRIFIQQSTINNQNSELALLRRDRKEGGRLLLHVLASRKIVRRLEGTFDFATVSIMLEGYDAAGRERIQSGKRITKT